ncbi:MAG: choloylglycine hydrolase [Salibacteraceae bacterium]|jgi:choloylglycine hydrolase
MDWATPLSTSLFVFQSGLEKSPFQDEEVGNYTPWSWIAKYASVVAMVGETDNFAASDGMNSEGLVANVLYANGTDYEIVNNKDTKQLSVLRWVQFVLDTCASVAEVVLAFDNNKIELIAAKVPGSTKPAALHLSVSDNTGESAIFEVYKDTPKSTATFHIYYSGNLEDQSDVVQNTSCNVMTNEPSFEIQLKLNDYWLWQWSKKNAFPSRTIPGGPFPSDRFERATFYYNQLVDSVDTEDIIYTMDITESLSESKSILANASVPISMGGFPGHPNIAPTIWTTLANHMDLVYYFGNARTPNLINVKMNEPMKKFDTLQMDLVVQVDKKFVDKNFDGCVNSDLNESTDPFRVK